MDNQNPMTVSIPPYLAAQMQQAVADGYCESVDEIVTQSIADRMFLYQCERTGDAELRAKIAEGEADIAAGRVVPFELSTFLSEVRKKFHIK
jgi:Arc/MetJ-type ribon-helix-helix transcriptional regulator